MSKTTSYSAIPYNYSLCLKADCQKASSCLRQLALTHVQNTKDEFQIVNPLKTQDQNGNCQFYRCSEVVSFGKGFRNLYDNLPRKQGRLFADLITNAFSERTYLYMRKGERLISPAEQELFKSFLIKCGATIPLTFDECVDDIVWQYRIYCRGLCSFPQSLLQFPAEPSAIFRKAFCSTFKYIGYICNNRDITL